ncbi:MAG: rRNA ((1498)-N(3))-methyltransferase [Polaromonas sp.]|nr:rRNA ((1498)-N(3))-methyltransferase [Polaromonas sp.]
MSARFHADLPLAAGTQLSLPPHAARHVQVLRLQPGDGIVLFNGQGDGQPGSEGEFHATIQSMGRSDVQVVVGAYAATGREPARGMHLAIGMPANERMDWLVEKATELGVASIQPLMAERSVLRLKGERSEKKLAHWRGIAIAACEQSGRNRVPLIHEAARFEDWIASLARPDLSGGPGGARLLLSLRDAARPLPQACPASGAVTFLSGPEGGLSRAEEEAALAAGFAPVTLGPRTLRAETAPLACLAWLGAASG